MKGLPPFSSKKQNTWREGFSAVELIIAMLAAAVLILTSSVLLAGFMRSYSNNVGVIEMQRDGHLATRLISRIVRGAAPSEVVAPLLNGGDSDALTVATRKVFRADAAMNPSSAGRLLVYDSDTTDSQNPLMVLVNADLENFSCRYAADHSIEVTMVMKYRDWTLNMPQKMYFRNVSD